MKGRVTFVMPAYNAASFIGEAIGSLQAQTVEDWELVVVDDGSTDDTASIAGRMAIVDSRISVLRLPVPSGCAYIPRKYGILAAGTEYVSPLDADDWIEADYLSRLFDVALQTDADIVYPTMWRSTGRIDRKPVRLVPSEDTFYGKVFAGRNVIRYTLDGWRIGAGGGLLRKSVYEDAFSRYKIDTPHVYSDELLTRQLLLLAPKVAFSEARYFYRANPASVTMKANARRFHYLINNVDLIDFCRREFGEDSPEYLLAQRQNFHGTFDALRQIEKLHPDGKKEVLDKVRASRRVIDRKLVRKTVSPRYYALSRIPLPLQSLILSLYDKTAGKE